MRVVCLRIDRLGVTVLDSVNDTKAIIEKFKTSRWAELTLKLCDCRLKVSPSTFALSAPHRRVLACSSSSWTPPTSSRVEILSMEKSWICVSALKWNQKITACDVNFLLDDTLVILLQQSTARTRPEQCLDSLFQNLSQFIAPRDPLVRFQIPLL